MKEYNKKNSKGYDLNNAAFKLFDSIKEKKSYVTVLSCLVVFITTYLLILPAITLDKDEADKQGGIDIQTQQEQLEDIPVKDSDADSNAKASDSDKIVLKTEPDVESGDITYTGKGYEVSANCDRAGLPEGTELVAEEVNKSDKSYNGLYEDALKAVQKDSDNKVSDLAFAKFYDISLLSDGEAIEPENPLNVKISFDKGLEASDAGNIRIVHFAVDEKTGKAETEVLDPETVDTKIKSGKMTEATFAAESFSVYAVVYAVTQINEDFITASGEKYEVAVTYDENAEIPEGATLEITEFSKDSKDYQEAREAVIDKMQSERPDFDDSEIGVAAFDLSILDKEGKQVEPKAAVDVSMKIKRLPEEAVEADAQNSIEIQHLDESSGDIKVETVASAVGGNIKIEDKTAQSEFQLESFSMFTISWRRSSSNPYTTLRWTYGNNGNQSWSFVQANYVDQNGNSIQRPTGLGGVDGWTEGNNGFTVNHWLGNNGNVSAQANIETVLAKDIDGYTFERAYIILNGAQREITHVVGRRDNPWNYNSLTYYNGNQQVHFAQNWSNQLSNAPQIYLEYSGDNHTTIHYGYMSGDTFVEFDEQPSPTDTSTELGWAHLIHDFYGTGDDGKAFQYRYAGTYYSANGETDTPVSDGVQIQPLLRYNENRWKYFDRMDYANLSMNAANSLITSNQNWKQVNDGSDIYLVYEEPKVTPGGTPTLKVDGQLPDAPNILKESVENEDGTNTLSLSVTGSTEPMVAEKVADVIVILDLSTSMSRAIDSRDKYTDYQSNTNSRFYQAKQALQKLADELYDRNDESGEPQYRLQLITFSNKATVKLAEPTADREAFQSVLDGITAHDTEEGTNWEHSLMVANQQDLPLDRATYIVFITDGGPTVRQTRLNLTDVQLDGYVQNDKNDHGDIFHGGLNNGSFYNNSNGYQADRLHFRDYLGNGSFGGIMDDPVWNLRNRTAAVDEVKSIIGHDKGFFAIGVSNDAASLETFVTSDEECGLSEDHYELVSSESHFLSAIDKVLDDLNGITGQSDVRMFDGITDLTQTISKVNQEENRLIGADGNFTYWKSNPPQATWDEVKATWTNDQKAGFNSGVAYAGQTGTPDDYAHWSKEKKATFELGKQSVTASGQAAKTPADLWAKVWQTWDKSLKDAYNTGVEYIGSDNTSEGYNGWSDEKKAAYVIGKKVTFSEWTTREADGCAPADYNTESGAVEWNMGETFMLEDGVTYKVSFICWPSQQAYDIIAKLENGTITFGDTTVYPQAVWDQFEGNATDGYTLKTNEDGAHTDYRSATSVSGKVTPGDEQDPLEFQHVPPMPLEKDKLNVAKTWQASRIDSQDPESVVLQVVGGNELYKEFEIEPTEKVDGSATNNYARSEDIYISCGHLKVNKGTGKVVVYESGHDFTLREVEENSRHWDLDASVCRPMKINTEPTMLVLVTGNDVPAGMTSDKDYYASGNDEYYRIEGKVYKDTKAWADITGMNTRRSFLDLSKEVLVDNQVWTDEVDTKFTYKIKIDIDPTTLSWDPDIERYIIISIRGNGYSPAAAIADETYPTTAVLPSQSELDPSLINEGDDDRYLVAESGQEFFLSIRNGWSVRFLNLPAGTEYSIEEVLPGDSAYEFDNVRLETRKDNSSTSPDTTDTKNIAKIESSIAETSTLYKVVYQNKPNDIDIRILKTSQDAVTPLGGAKFDLYTQSAYTATPRGTPFKTNLVSSSATDTKGRIELGTLPAGTYYLVETEAPDGFSLRTDPVTITVNKDSVTYNDGTTLSSSGEGISQTENLYQLTVTNEEGVTLPNAGGPGTTWIYLIGSLLLLGCGIALVSRRRTQKN